MLPIDWMESTFAMIPTKTEGVKCSEYRNNRLHKILEEKSSGTQFGFWNDLGTKETLFGIQVIFTYARLNSRKSLTKCLNH